MDPTLDIDEEEQDRLLTRSNSWSHTQRPAFMADNNNQQQQQQQHHRGAGGGNHQSSINRPLRPNGLSCIYETDDSVMVNQQHQHSDTPDFSAEQRNRSKSMSGVTGVQQAQGKKRRHSYTELIASAILSSSEKRKTLAEIYDWFVSNVPSFKDQRYMHSSLGWKNAVRHNLSVQTCFKRVKRHGMEKPSWWTVDMNEVAKRRLVLRPTLNHATPNGTSNGGGGSNVSNGNVGGDLQDEAGPFLPPRRNTYSGPHPNSQSTSSASVVNNNDVHESHRIAYRVASTNDMTSGNLQFMNTNNNAKRGSPHYALIRPAALVASNSASDLSMRGGNARYTSSGSTESFGDVTGFNGNEGLFDDSVFLKPCALDRMSKLSPTSLVPSMTLVCKEPPSSTHPYGRAQLEVSFNESNGQHHPQHQHQQQLNSLSPSSWSTTPSTGASPAAISPNGTTAIAPNGQVFALGHFNSWPNIVEHVGAPPNGGIPNQTLRIKTAWGNVEDINFNGLLPMRTVVKCDGTTQTSDVANQEKRKQEQDAIMKSCARPQWDMDMFQYQSQSLFQDTSIPSDLPEDLAGLQIEGDLHCDIDEVLGASFDPCGANHSNGKTQQPTWSNGWTTSPPWSDHSSSSPMFTDRSSDDSSSYASRLLSQSPFAAARMDVSEI